MKEKHHQHNKPDRHELLRKQVLKALSPLPPGAAVPNLSKHALAQYARSPEKLNPLSEEARDMLLGTILGDASMGWTTTFPRYSAVHSTKQKAYCQSKLKLLQDYCTPIAVKEAENLGYGKKVVRFATLTTPVLEFIRHLCYKPDPSTPSGLRKAITEERVEQLNWRQVAWWFQDDGCKQSRGMNFATHAFPREEVEILVSWFLKSGVDAKLKKVSKGEKNYWIIHISTEGAEVLVDEIRPFVHPSLAYKLPTFLDKVGTCLNCGAPTEKATKMGRPVRLCSGACRTEWETQRGKNRWMKMSNEERKKRYEKEISAIKADPERHNKWKAYHANRRKEIASDPEKKAARNAYKREWRKKQKAMGNSERKLQKHTCLYCQDEFSNSATHKMSPRSPVISCAARACMDRREEDYRELRRKRAREKGAREKLIKET